MTTKANIIVFCASALVGGLLMYGFRMHTKEEQPKIGMKNWASFFEQTSGTALTEYDKKQIIIGNWSQKCHSGLIELEKGVKSDIVFEKQKTDKCVAIRRC